MERWMDGLMDKCILNGAWVDGLCGWAREPLAGMRETQEWMGVESWAGDGEWVHMGVGGEEPVPVVLVSWKVIDLSGMPHTLRTDTWQV